MHRKKPLAHPLKRNGHLDCLLQIIMVSMICTILQTALLDGPCKDWPQWGKIALWQFNPGVLLAELFVLVWVLVWLPILIEGGALQLNLAVWQYDQRKTLGLPNWLLQRTALLISGFALSTVSLLICGWKFEQFLEASFWQLQFFGLIAFAWILAISWILALFKTGGNLELIFQSCYGIVDARK